MRRRIAHLRRRFAPTLAVGLVLAAACGEKGAADPTPDVPAADVGSGGTGPVGLLPGTDAGPDASPATARLDAGRTEPPPPPPPLDDDTAVHFIVERDAALRVARAVPAGGYVGPVGDPLPVLPADLEDDASEPVLFARDEGPRLVVDLASAGVLVGEGGAWTKLGDVPTGPETVRFFEVAPGVDRVFLGYRTYDMTTFQYSSTGTLWSTAGDTLYTTGPIQTWLLSTFGVFGVGGTRIAVRDATSLTVRDTADGSEIARVASSNEDVLALFETSVVVGSTAYPRWIDFDAAVVTVEGLPAAWRVVEVMDALHTEIDGKLYRVADRALVEVATLPAGLAAASVLGYAEGAHLAGLAFGAPDDAGVRERSYVVAAPDGVILDVFAPEPSVVEEEGGLTDVEWERRPTARASHVDAERLAVLFEVRHTYFRGAYGASAALTEELWVRDASGVRTHRIGQYPPDADTGGLPEHDRRWIFTGDGEYLVWLDGDVFRALSVDTLELVELREAF